MAVGYATTLRSNRMTQVINAIDAGASTGKLRIYTATRPATGAAITTQTLLAELSFADPCGTVTNGVLTFSALTADSSADATGTAAWARVVDSDGNFVMDMSVTATGGGGDIELNTTSILQNGLVQGTATRTLTEGNA